MARYPDAIWTPANPANEGGPIGKISLVVDHIEQGSETGTNAWFANAKAQVSAHFGISKLGQVFQFVDTGVIAWAEQDYNDIAISIEHEGLSGQKFTPQQISAEAKLGAWIHQTHGVPVKRATNATQQGWIGHGELGVPGGNHIHCPGDAALAQIPEILKAINAIVTPQPTHVPTTTQLQNACLVGLHSASDAEQAIKNGWPLYIWTGLAFALVGHGNPVTIARFANVHWQSPRSSTEA